MVIDLRLSARAFDTRENRAAQHGETQRALSSMMYLHMETGMSSTGHSTRSERFYAFNDKGYRKMYGRTVRSAAALPPNERAVLLFVLQLTLGWNKVWARIAPQDFQRGVWRRIHGRRLASAPGLGLSAEEIGAAIAGLVECGALLSAHFDMYALNENWMHPAVIPMWSLDDSDYIYSEV